MIPSAEFSAVSDDPLNNGRQTGGRFAAGNKASRGRPKGARDRASAIAEKLFAADITGIAKKVVEAAKNGEFLGLQADH